LQEVELDDGYEDFKGVVHSHSYLSHDSEGSIEQIVRCAREAGVHFIFMTDHPDPKGRIFTEGARGEHDGVFFFTGAEMAGSLLPFRRPEDTRPVILTKEEGTALGRAGSAVARSRGVRPTADQQAAVDAGMTVQQALIDEVIGDDGLVFVGHPEETYKLTGLQRFTGQEIYNIHSDLLDERIGGKKFLMIFVGTMLTAERFPFITWDETFYDVPTEVIACWDQLTEQRKVVGIAGNDAHSNVGFYAKYLEDGTVRLYECSGEELRGRKAGPVLRTALRLLPGPLEPGTELFRAQMDPYERSFGFVSTHLLAKKKTEEEFWQALARGHAFVAFDWLAPSRGFTFVARNEDGDMAVMGDEIEHSLGLRLEVVTPALCRIYVVRNGKTVETWTDARHVSYRVSEPGTYRIEAHVYLGKKLRPWIYSNPIYVRPAESGDGG